MPQLTQNEFRIMQKISDTGFNLNGNKVPFDCVYPQILLCSKPGVSSGNSTLTISASGSNMVWESTIVALNRLIELRYIKLEPAECNYFPNRGAAGSYEPDMSRGCVSNTVPALWITGEGQDAYNEYRTSWIIKLFKLEPAGFTALFITLFTSFFSCRNDKIVIDKLEDKMSALERKLEQVNEHPVLVAVSKPS